MIPACLPGVVLLHVSMFSLLVKLHCAAGLLSLAESER